MGRGELGQYTDAPSAAGTKGARGGLEQCDGQSDVLESGLKGAAGGTPGPDETGAAVNQPVSPARKR